MNERQLIGINVDLNEYGSITSALLEDLVLTYGFEPKLDIPFCLEYFDINKIDQAKDNVTALIYKAVIGEDDFLLDYNNSVEALTELVMVIVDACETYNIDHRKLVGVDLIFNGEDERMVAWFNREDTQWKQQI